MNSSIKLNINFHNFLTQERKHILLPNEADMDIPIGSKLFWYLIYLQFYGATTDSVDIKANTTIKMGTWRDGTNIMSQPSNWQVLRKLLDNQYIDFIKVYQVMGD